MFSKRTVGIGVPAGYIEDGEDSYVAALRELEEETALVTAYKRNFDALENVRVDIDKKTGATHLYSSLI